MKLDNSPLLPEATLKRDRKITIFDVFIEMFVLKSWALIPICVWFLVRTRKNAMQTMRRFDILTNAWVEYIYMCRISIQLTRPSVHYRFCASLARIKSFERLLFPLTPNSIQ